MLIGVTGSTGFIGSNLVRFLGDAGHDIRSIVRDRIGDPKAYAGCEGVVHLAADPSRSSTDRNANHDLAVSARKAAGEAGVKRFVFVSTSFVTTETKNPDAYTQSKAATERTLLAMPGVETVILRPPLVYGRGVKGNLRALMKICASPVPLPFGSVRNRRSMIGVTSLVSAIEFVLTADSSISSKIFNVADDEPISLARLLTQIRGAMGKSPRLVPVPVSLLKLGLSPRPRMVEQLLGDHVIDIGTLKATGWKPRSPDHDIREMVLSYQATA